MHIEDGQTRFSGLLVRSTGFAAPPALARAADAASRLYERWDDREFAAAFARPDVRDALRAGFAQIRAARGRCKLAPDALTGLYGDGERSASLPLACERGGPANLELSIDGSGKVTSIFVRQPEGKERGGCG